MSLLPCPHCDSHSLFHESVSETDTKNYDHEVTTWVDYFKCQECSGKSSRRTSITSLIPHANRG